jgi:hypothetical protein
MALHDDIDIEVGANRLAQRWRTIDLLANAFLNSRYASRTLTNVPYSQSIELPGLFGLGAGLQVNPANPKYYRVGTAGVSVVFARPGHLSALTVSVEAVGRGVTITAATPDDTGVEPIVEDDGDLAAIHHPKIALLSANAAEALKQLVDEMQNAESWDKALLNYLYKGRSFYQTQDDLAEITWKGSALSRLIITQQSWTIIDQRVAEQWAQEIFKWGGTRQRSPVTWRKVYGTIENALKNSQENRDGPMNSGYSKVASFATAFLDGILSNGLTAQVIFDSRVAASLTFRLDRILQTQFPGISPESMFPALGTLVAASSSGTRPRDLQLTWQDGYKMWWAQYGATQCVARIRDILNDKTSVYPAMPGVDDSSVNWTLRGVEAVLFKDGY